VSNVEIRTVELTENMVRAIAKQAEAERDRRAKIIHAEAEFQASQTLVNAAKILSSIPAAMQLRYLQTLTEIGAEQNSTIVFPMPIDIIKPFLDLVEKSGKPAGANGRASSASWAMFADGVQWKLLNGGALAASAAQVYCTNPPVLTPTGNIPENKLGLILGRHIDGGMHEDIDITNYGSQKVCFNLEIAIRSDFADIFEVKGKNVTRRGEIRSDWSAAAQELTTTYQHEDFSRALKVTASGQHSAMSYANGRLSFNIELQPGASWHTCLLYAFANDDSWSTAPKKCVDDYMNSGAATAQKLWKEASLRSKRQRYICDCLRAGCRRYVSAAFADRGH
jgi:hypothetical protein